MGNSGTKACNEVWTGAAERLRLDDSAVAMPAMLVQSASGGGLVSAGVEDQWLESGDKICDSCVSSCVAFSLLP